MIEIRLCRHDDVPKLAAIAEEKHPLLVEHTFERQERDRSCLMICAFESGELLGHVWLDIDVTPPYLWNLFVVEAYRRVGIGTRLMDEAERVASMRHHCIELNVAYANFGARLMYERRGYKISGRRTGTDPYAGLFNQLIMRKEF